jgi:GNAT superfamily N-acetyltransferase
MNRLDELNKTRARTAHDAGYRVRPMRLSDAESAAEVHVQVWREAYDGLLPAGYLAGLDPRSFAQRRRAHLVDPGAAKSVLGLDPAGRIVAVAAAGPARDEDAPTPWELFAINVLAGHHGTGLADLVMAELVGERATYLWVLEGNERARAFYARYGFVADGATKLHPPTGRVEMRMRRAPENPCTR